MMDVASRWYRESHYHLRHNGTLAASVRYLGSLATRVEFAGQKRENGQWVPDENPYTARFVDSLVTLDHTLAIEHLAGVGLTYLVAHIDDLTLLRWEVFSASELQWWTTRNSGPMVQRSPMDPLRPLWTAETPVSKRPAVLRVHRPDLEWSNEPWSPVAAVLSHLEALHLMVLAEKALDTSRIAGAGILFLPNSIAFPDMMGTGEARDVTKSPTFRRLVKAIVEPIGDRSSTDAVTPVVLTGPDDAGDKIKHLLFERRDDPNAWAIRRDSHLREIARAMDLPAGRVLNNDDQAKFANSSSISDESVDIYLPRFTTLLANDITQRVYRGVMTQWGVEDAHLRRLWPNDDALRAQEDRTAEALQLRAAGVITRKGLARMASVPDDEFMAEGSSEYREWVEERRILGQAPQPVAPTPDPLLPPDPAVASVPFRLAILEAESSAATIARLAALPALSPTISDVDRLRQLGQAASSEGLRVNLAEFTLNGTAPFNGTIPRAEMPQLDGVAQGVSTGAKAFTAAPTAPARDWAPIVDTLNRIDADLTAALTAAAELALETALVAAGRKVAARTKSVSMRESLADIPARHVIAVAGAAHVAAVGLTEDDLTRGAVEGLTEVADRIIADHQGSAAAALGDLAPETGQLTEWRRHAVEALGASMLTLTRSRLHDADPKFDPRGETPAVARAVPTSLIRDVMAKAGNEQVAPDVRPTGGMATGGGMLAGVRADPAAPRTQWRWVHGTPAHPFPPHQNLSGAVFASLDDGRLNASVADRWTGYRTYAPGDHAGCQCALILELAEQP